MNAAAAIAGDGVPLDVSNPQSARLAAAERELAQAHAYLDGKGVRRASFDGVRFTLSERTQILVLRAAAQQPEPMPCPDDPVDAIEIGALAGDPFPDDDPMLPRRPSTSPRPLSRRATAALWAGFACCAFLLWLLRASRTATH